MTELAAFLGIAALVIVTPGQDTALTIRNTLLGGRQPGVFTALGVAAGQAVWTFGAAAGLTAVVLASERAFEALRLAGAAYLVVLGAQALLGALRGVPRRHEARGARRALGAGRAFRQGLVSNLANPKMAVFFTSLLPQFADAFASMLALGLVFCSLTLAWLSGYAYVVARAGDVLRRPRVRRALEAATGTILVALGLRVATSER
jgi:threonine/homoserine/homoserine lactone efflux protein